MSFALLRFSYTAIKLKRCFHQAGWSLSRFYAVQSFSLAAPLSPRRLISSPALIMGIGPRGRIPAAGFQRFSFQFIREPLGVATPSVAPIHGNAIRSSSSGLIRARRLSRGISAALQFAWNYRGSDSYAGFAASCTDSRCVQQAITPSIIVRAPPRL